MPKRPYPRWRRRHDAILFHIIEHPGAKHKAIAAATGYSPSQVSRIMCSPDFQAAYMALRGEVAEKAIMKVLSADFTPHDFDRLSFFSTELRLVTLPCLRCAAPPRTKPHRARLPSTRLSLPCRPPCDSNIVNGSMQNTSHGGDGFLQESGTARLSGDASLIKADANKQRSAEGSEVSEVGASLEN